MKFRHMQGKTACQPGSCLGGGPAEYDWDDDEQEDDDENCLCVQCQCT